MGTNSIVLSNSGLSLGCTYICRVPNILNMYHLSMCLVLSLTFTIIQIKEFHAISLYVNESIYSSVFFFLTGLHFSHVVVGIILISLILCTCYYIKSVYIESLIDLRISPHHIYSSLQLVYWHFVELLWLFIYYILYTY